MRKISRIRKVKVNNQLHNSKLKNLNTNYIPTSKRSVFYASKNHWMKYRKTFGVLETLPPYIPKFKRSSLNVQPAGYSGQPFRNCRRPITGANIFVKGISCRKAKKAKLRSAKKKINKSHLVSGMNTSLGISDPNNNNNNNSSRKRSWNSELDTDILGSVNEAFVPSKKLKLSEEKEKRIKRQLLRQIKINETSMSLLDRSFSSCDLTIQLTTDSMAVPVNKVISKRGKQEIKFSDKKAALLAAQMSDVQICKTYFSTDSDSLLKNDADQASTSKDDSVIIVHEDIKSLNNSVNDTSVLIISDSEDDKVVRSSPQMTIPANWFPPKEVDIVLELSQIPKTKEIPRVPYRTIHNPRFPKQSTMRRKKRRSSNLQAIHSKNEVKIVSEKPATSSSASISELPRCKVKFPRAKQGNIFRETTNQNDRPCMREVPLGFIDTNSVTAVIMSDHLPAQNPKSQIWLNGCNKSVIPENLNTSSSVGSTLKSHTNNVPFFNVKSIINLRPIIIDGSNVAMEHGKKDKKFSCAGIELCVKYFQNRGHKDITAIVPQHRRNKRKDITRQDILEQYALSQTVVFTPSRMVNGRLISSYDDRFVLDLAARTGGVIVSNDNYRDLKHEKPEWLNAVDNRLLMFLFVGDHFMVPEDPLGRKGPKLDQFLAFPI